MQLLILKMNIARQIRYQILSDLHLENIVQLLTTKSAKSRFHELIRRKYFCEHCAIFTPPPLTPYLFLAGDIGSPLDPNYTEFMKYCSANFKRVFLVTGNHEYHLSHPSSIYSKIQNWNKSIDVKIQFILQKNKLHNIHFLQANHHYPQSNSYPQLNNHFSICGTTLWTPITDSLKNRGYDMRVIPQWSTEVRNSLYRQHADYLLKTIATITNKPLIIMTHHLPSHSLLLPSYEKSNLVQLYSSQLWDTINSTNISRWIYGHTHQSSDNLRKEREINRVFEANPLGSVEKKTIDEIEEIFTRVFTI
jgi:hypothetical protein